MTKKAKKQATDTDYSSETFWNNRYETDSLGHEWYYTYDILEPLLVSMTEGADLDSCKALDVGCGDRPLVDRFHKLGLKNKNLCGMDFSKAVIDKLNAQQADAPEPIAYIKADAKNMVDFASNSYDVVVDKGTTDCLLSSSNRKAGIASALKAVSEIVRILTVTGSFMLVSHIDTDSDEFDVLISDILMPALQGKKMVDWSIKAHIVPDESQSTGEESCSINPFACHS